MVFILTLNKVERESDRLTWSTFADQISRDSLDQLPGALEMSKVLDKIPVLPEAQVADALPRFTGLLNGQPIEKKRIAMVGPDVCRATRSPITDTLLHEVDDEEDFVSTQTTLLLAGLYRDPPATPCKQFRSASWPASGGLTKGPRYRLWAHENGPRQPCSSGCGGNIPHSRSEEPVYRRDRWESLTNEKDP